MRRELKLWLDYSSPEQKPKSGDLTRLCSALRAIVSADRLEETQYACIAIQDSVPAEIASIKEVAASLAIPISCKFVERFSRRELPQLRLVRLTLEGDSVDNDVDGNPLNRFPSLLCGSCRMPDESRLPDPFYVSGTQMLRRTQDGVHGLQLKRDREAFTCAGGIVVVSGRLRRILDMLEQPLLCASVVGTPRKEVARGFHALRPAHNWGRRKNAVSSVQCADCGRPRRCNVGPDLAPEALYANRLVMDEERLPEPDLICSETWFGDRTRRPSESADFSRDIYVSGQLYDLLLKAKVRGLMPPESVVAFRDLIPMVQPAAAQAWLSEKLKLLKEAALL